MEKNISQYRIGTAIYTIERVFSDSRTPHEVVVEEIISTAKQENIADHSLQK